VAGERVLVVDDHPQNLKLARVLLTGEGYEVRTATDGAEALRVLESYEPQLVLTDVQMPGVGGLELTQQLKADPKRRHIKVVVFTAYAMKSDEQRALAAGCDAWLSKPIDTDKLLKVLAEVLRR
jgi:two-component system, cell cycle response regulator DivK